MIYCRQKQISCFHPSCFCKPQTANARCKQYAFDYLPDAQNQIAKTFLAKFSYVVAKLASITSTITSVLHKFGQAIVIFLQQNILTILHRCCVYSITLLCVSVINYSYFKQRSTDNIYRVSALRPTGLTLEINLRDTRCQKSLRYLDK